MEDTVIKSASFLDARFPGWERRIDLNVLNIWDSQLCVLGQLADSMSEAEMWALDDSVTRVPNPHDDQSCAYMGSLGLCLSGFAWLAALWGLHDVNYHYCGGFADDCTKDWIALVKARFESGALSDDLLCHA